MSGVRVMCTEAEVREYDLPWVLRDEKRGEHKSILVAELTRFSLVTMDLPLAHRPFDNPSTGGVKRWGY